MFLILGQSVDMALKNNVVAYVPQAEEVDWSFPVLVEDVVMMGRYGHMNFMRMTRDIDQYGEAPVNFFGLGHIGHYVVFQGRIDGLAQN